MSSTSVAVDNDFITLVQSVVVTVLTDAVAAVDARLDESQRNAAATKVQALARGRSARASVQKQQETSPYSRAAESSAPATPAQAPDNPTAVEAAKLDADDRANEIAALMASSPQLIPTPPPRKPLGPGNLQSFRSQSLRNNAAGPKSPVTPKDRPLSAGSKQSPASGDGSGLALSPLVDRVRRESEQMTTDPDADTLSPRAPASPSFGGRSPRSSRVFRVFHDGNGDGEGRMLQGSPGYLGKDAPPSLDVLLSPTAAALREEGSSRNILIPSRSSPLRRESGASPEVSSPPHASKDVISPLKQSARASPVTHSPLANVRQLESEGMSDEPLIPTPLTPVLKPEPPSQHSDAANRSLKRPGRSFIQSSVVESVPLEPLPEPEVPVELTEASSDGHVDKSQDVDGDEPPRSATASNTSSPSPHEVVHSGDGNNLSESPTVSGKASVSTRSRAGHSQRGQSVDDPKAKDAKKLVHRLRKEATAREDAKRAKELAELERISAEMARLDEMRAQKAVQAEVDKEAAKQRRREEAALKADQRKAKLESAKSFLKHRELPVVAPGKSPSPTHGAVRSPNRPHAAPPIHPAPVPAPRHPQHDSAETTYGVSMPALEERKKKLAELRSQFKVGSPVAASHAVKVPTPEAGEEHRGNSILHSRPVNDRLAKQKKYSELVREVFNGKEAGAPKPRRTKSARAVQDSTGDVDHRAREVKSGMALPIMPQAGSAWDHDAAVFDDEAAESKVTDATKGNKKKSFKKSEAAAPVQDAEARFNHIRAKASAVKASGAPSLEENRRHDGVVDGGDDVALERHVGRHRNSAPPRHGATTMFDDDAVPWDHERDEDGGEWGV